MTVPRIRFNAFWARKGFTLDVTIETSTRVLGIVGSSGSGKSSIIDIVSGQAAPERGHLYFGDECWMQRPRGHVLSSERRGIGLVAQEGLLFSHLNVRDNLLFSAERGGVSSKPKLEQLACQLGISELLERPTTALSGGQRQRVALGRALLSNPRWLLLDEPLGALDLERRRSLLPLLRQIVETTEVPLWIVSHDPVEVQALCDEVVVIEAGRVTEQGPPERLLGRTSRTTGGRAEHYENLLAGVLESSTADITRVRLGEGLLFECSAIGSTARGHALAPLGARVYLSLMASDIMLSPQVPVGLSARNVLAATVATLPSEQVSMVGLKLSTGLVLYAQLTNGAIEALQLAIGTALYVVFKASSCRVWTV